jgi:UDP-N-acetylglucosamine acyltransferase
MTAPRIHPTAVIHPGAALAADVSVAAYAVIGDGVEIGSGTSIGAHAVIYGPTTIGRDNKIFGFVSLGEAPQDKKYAGEPTRLEIGDRNTIREFCTFNRGTTQDAHVTKVGNDNWIMAYAHIAHDCHVGNHTIFANNSQLAGHVHVGDYAILGGFTAVHQFVHIGPHSMTAIGTILLQDVPAFVTVAGNTAKPFGINSEGLKRRGFSTDSIASIKSAYKALYKSGLSLAEAVAAIEARAVDCPELKILLDSIAVSTRGLVR